MKKQVFALVAVLIITMIFALSICGAGEEVSQNYKNQEFTALSIASGMKLEVKQSEKYAVMVRTTKNQFKRLRVEQSGKTLKFYLLPSPFSMTYARIEILVTMPELVKLSLSGGSTAHMTMDIAGKTFLANFSGGSELTGSLQAQRVELDLSGGSRSSLTGGAEEMNIGASGGSRVQQENFQVNQAHLDLSGGSMVYLHVKEAINVSASGGSQVNYRGTPRLERTSFSGGSAIHSME